jgi:hypothetical protein
MDYAPVHERSQGGDRTHASIFPLEPHIDIALVVNIRPFQGPADPDDDMTVPIEEDAISAWHKVLVGAGIAIGEVAVPRF